MIKKSHMILIEKIPMPNGLTVEAWDKSVSIAADTTEVALLIRIPVDPRPSYLAKPDHYELVRTKMGPEIFFAYKKELDRFEKNSMPYLSRPSFPASLALSKHLDIEKNSYKYNSFPVTTLPGSPDGTSPTLAKSLFEKET